VDDYSSSKFTELANHIWSVADLLRGDYKQSDYGKVILPFTVLRRLECVLAPTREKVVETYERYKDKGIDVDRFLRRASEHSFYNTSAYTLKAIANDPSQAAKHLLAYVGAFSPNAREVFEKYEFPRHIQRLDSANEVIAEAIRVAAAALNPTDRTLLSLRSRRAAILILGGDFRRALPEFDALAETYARIDGPTSDDALLCLRQAAHCRAQLGETTAALRQFRQVLTHVRARSGDASPTALELRRDIGFLLLAESKTTEAAQVLKDLHEDLCLVSGPDRPEAQEVARVLRLLNVFTDA